MSREQQIQELTNALTSLTSGVILSDSVDSESAVSGGVAATPKAVKTAYDKSVEAYGKAVEALDAASNVKFTTITYWE